MKCLGKGQSDQQQSQEEGCGCKEGRCLVTPRRTKDTIRTSDHETTKPQRAERQKTSRWWRWLRPEKGVGLKRPRVMARTTNKVPSKGQSDRQGKLLRNLRRCPSKSGVLGGHTISPGPLRCRLTLPSRGRPQSGFACLRPPLMSNVRQPRNVPT